MTDFKTPIARVQEVYLHPDTELKHLSIVKVCDKLCISGNLENNSPRYKEGNLVLFYPINSIIPVDFLKFQGFYWNTEKDKGMLKGSKGNRVGPVKRGTITSEGLLFPVDVYPEYNILVGDGDYSVIEGEDMKDRIGIIEYIP